MPVKYIPYYPNTVEGQAVLDNVTRTRRVLRYRDNDRVYERIKRGMPYYELEHIESVGNNKENLLIRGECLSACAYLKDKGFKVDLVCIDPPFASGADYAKKVYLRRNPKVAEAIAQAEENGNGGLDLEELRAFEEKMYGDIWNKEDYLNWMYENLHAIKSVMSETASIYVHLDWHIGHYVKILMDEVFGEDSFLNEIVWKRFNFHADAQRFGTVHETIYLYSKDPENYVFNLQSIPFKESYIKSHFSNVDDTGRAFRLDNPTAPAHGKQGQALRFGDKVLAPPAGAMWRFKQENIDKLMAEGRIVFTNSGMPAVKRYLDELEGTAIHTIWDDVFPVNSQATERGDYATQKPETLLARIIRASSSEGMIIADLFGGSGVAAKVAHDLKRKFIHVDVGVNSIQTTRDRLKAAGAEFDILDIKDGVSLFRNPVQTMDKLKMLITGLKNEDSLASFWEGAISDSKLGLVPVYVPNLLDHSTKVLDIPLMNRVINEAMPDLPEGVKKVIVYYVDVENEPELKKFISDYNATNIEIELRDLKSILDEVIFNDEVDYELRESKTGYEIEFTSFVSDRLMQAIDGYNQKKSLGDSPPLNLPLAKGEHVGVENGAPNGEDSESVNGNRKKTFKPIEISKHGLELIELVSLDCTNANGPWKSDTELKIDKNGHVIRDGKKTKEIWNAKIASVKKPLRMKVRNIAGDETVVVL